MKYRRETCQTHHTTLHIIGARGFLKVLINYIYAHLVSHTLYRNEGKDC